MADNKQNQNPPATTPAAPPAAAPEAAKQAGPSGTRKYYRSLHDLHPITMPYPPFTRIEAGEVFKTEETQWTLNQVAAGSLVETTRPDED